MANIYDQRPISAGTAGHPGFLGLGIHPGGRQQRACALHHRRAAQEMLLCFWDQGA